MASIARQPRAKSPARKPQKMRTKSFFAFAKVNTPFQQNSFRKNISKIFKKIIKKSALFLFS